LITFWLGIFQRLPLKKGRFKDRCSNIGLPKARSKLDKGTGNLARGITPADATNMFGGDHIFKGDREFFGAK
jgi:hypothetical protein